MAQQSSIRPVLEKISRNLTPNFYITNDDEEIIDALVDHGKMVQDFSVSQVTSFLADQDFCLAFYFADEVDRGFSMYIIRDFSVNIREMIQLEYVLDQIMDHGYNYHLFHSARSKVDEMLYMAPTFRAMWEKKNQLDEEEEC